MLSKNNEYDVIIIGGGATGAGTARDCAMRGLKTLIVERLDFTAGATGIGNIEVVAPQFNGAIYNLAGQKVGADYKGIVIKNGKKFIQ
mgnify:CR=1 FL=1